MSNIKSFFRALGLFLGGFVGWLVLSFSFVVAVALLIDMLSIIPIVSLTIQLIGLGFTYRAFRRNLRWLGIGIICALFLYFLGFILHSGCIPPGVPYPLSVFPCL
jgi:hypothetical protein